MRAEQGVFKLLQQLPAIHMTTLSDNIKCCGSAGSYMLEHPQMAQALLDDLLAAVPEKQLDCLATSNIGCALHIAAGLRVRDVAFEVLHPVALIARNIEA